MIAASILSFGMLTARAFWIDAAQRRVGCGVGAAVLDGDRDVLADARELLRHAVPAREHRVLSDFEDATHDLAGCGGKTPSLRVPQGLVRPRRPEKTQLAVGDFPGCRRPCGSRLRRGPSQRSGLSWPPRVSSEVTGFCRVSRSSRYQRPCARRRPRELDQRVRDDVDRIELRAHVAHVLLVVAADLSRHRSRLRSCRSRRRRRPVNSAISASRSWWSKHALYSRRRVRISSIASSSSMVTADPPAVDWRHGIR